MSKKWTDEIAKENDKFLKDYGGAAESWRDDALKLENARYGQQFSLAETKEILAFRQAPTPISISTAICDTADALTVASKPAIAVSPIIYPFDDEKTNLSGQVSSIFNSLIEDSWFSSLGTLQFDRAVTDTTNVGHGLLYAVPRNEFGEFRVDIKHLSWRYFFGDPTSKDPLYRDMDAMVYAMPISFKAAYRFVKSIETDISEKRFREEWFEGATDFNYIFKEDIKYAKHLSTQESCVFIQRITLEEDNMYVVMPTSPEFAKEMGMLGFRTYMEVTDELKKLEAKGYIKIQKRTKFYATEYTSIGKLGYKVVYNLSQLNIVPLQHDHRGKPFPYSRMYYLYPIQRAINKFVMTSVLNASLLNSTRVLAEEGSILNMKEYIMSASQPGAVIKYRLATPGISKPPEVIEAKPLTEAHLVMPRFLMEIAEYISSIYSTMMGNPQGSPDVFSTVASLQSAAGLKIKQRMARHDASLSVLGQVVGEAYKEYAPLNGYTVRDFLELQEGGKGKDKIIRYNTIDIKDVEENGEIKKKVSIDPSTDLSYGFRKVRFTSAGSSGYEAATEAQMLSNLIQTTGKTALLPELLKRIPIANREELIKELDENDQLKGQLNQAGVTVKELTQKTKLLETQIFQLAKALSAAEVKGNMKEILGQFKENPMKFLTNALQQTTE